MIHAGSEYQKPEDYLDAFARFVRDNPEHIEAIRILLERPKDWRTEVLEDLRQKLKLNRFPEEQLQKAHKLAYKKALADIISMVKHGAQKQAPLLTAAERVDRAMVGFMAGKTFDDEQQRWLEYIRLHLTETLTIEMEHLDYAPIFSRRGGMGQARKVFGDQLETILQELNYAIAA